MKKPAVFQSLVIAMLLCLMPVLAHAEVSISNAWVRASVPGQSVGAAYLTFRSPQHASLVYVETERAGTVEMHSMRMENGVMKMRQIEALSIPAGQTVALAPGGLHLMLFELSAPFKAGEQVKFRLCFKDMQGHISEQFLTMPVKAAP